MWYNYKNDYLEIDRKCLNSGSRMDITTSPIFLLIYYFQVLLFMAINIITSTGQTLGNESFYAEILSFPCSPQYYIILQEWTDESCRHKLLPSSDLSPHVAMWRPHVHLFFLLIKQSRVTAMTHQVLYLLRADRISSLCLVFITANFITWAILKHSSLDQWLWVCDIH